MIGGLKTHLEGNMRKSRDDIAWNPVHCCHRQLSDCETAESITQDSLYSLWDEGPLTNHLGPGFYWEQTMENGSCIMLGFFSVLTTHLPPQQ